MADHSRVKEVFFRARDMSLEEREAYLRDACADDATLQAKVEALLSADDRAGSFMEPLTAQQRSDAPTEAMSVEQPGQVLGHYKLLERIGEGGFGSVWMAEQTVPVKRRVALKIIKLGMESKQVIARFEAERQALAMMDHPNIATVLDAGTTESGRPYFVMEHIRGIPIIDYCDSERLDTTARLGLFVEICHAIQHAHQKGIIHRDIKPTNVLVTVQGNVPVPKVIDFGIAKATNQELTEKTIHTHHHQMIGTPAYMSPEQAEMSGLDIDTRSDIYSLGVLLYELLTGTTPFSAGALREKGYAEMVRIIREDEPPRPSSRLNSLGSSLTTAAQSRRTDPKRLGALIRGDLDWIVMRCLEKDRTRRYDTASAVASDIRRHLNDEPVSAGPPSTAYRVRKFARRHQRQVFAGLAIASAILLGLAATSWQWVAATRANHVLEANASLARDTLLNILVSTSSFIPSEGDMRAGASDDDVLQRQAALYIRAMGNDAGQDERVQRGEIGLLAAVAEHQVTRAIELRDRLEAVAQFQSEQIGAIDVESMGLRIRGSIVDAADPAHQDQVRELLGGVNFTTIAVDALDANFAQQSIDAIDARFSEQPVIQAALLQATADTLAELGLLDRAIEPQQRACSLRLRELGAEHPDTLMSMHHMASIHADLGDAAKAEAIYGDTLETSLRVLGSDDPVTLTLMTGAGDVAISQGKLLEAERFYTDSLEGRQRTLGPEHEQTMESMDDVATLRQRQGRFDEAEQALREVLEMRRRILGEDHRDTLASLFSLGGMLAVRGRYEDAEPFLREALRGYRRVFGDRHPDTILFKSQVGYLLLSQGRYTEADVYLTDVLEASKEVFGDAHPSTFDASNLMGMLRRYQSRHAEAEAHYRDALRGHLLTLGSEHPSTLASRNNLGELLTLMGRLDEAEVHVREAFEVNERTLGRDHPNTLNLASTLGSLLHRQGKFSDSERFWRLSVDGQRRVLGDEHPRYLAALSNLSLLLADMGQGELALQLANDALDTAKRVLPPEHFFIGNFLGKRGRALQAMGLHADAESSMMAGHDNLTAALGDEHEQTQRVVVYLCELYEAWHEVDPHAGHDEEAAQWRRKVIDGSE